MFPSFNIKAVVVGALFASGAIAAPTSEIQQTRAAPIAPSFTMNTTDSWTKVQSVATSTGSAMVGPAGVIAPLPTAANVVVNVALPEAAAVAAVEKGTDVGLNGVLAVSWDYCANFDHSTDDQVYEVHAEKADDDKSADDPAAAPAADPAANPHPISGLRALIEWAKFNWDCFTGRIYKKARVEKAAHAKAKAEAAADTKAKAEAAENVSENWTMDDPDYNGDECDEGHVVTAARRVRFFQT